MRSARARHVLHSAQQFVSDKMAKFADIVVEDKLYFWKEVKCAHISRRELKSFHQWRSSSKNGLIFDFACAKHP